MGVALLVLLSQRLETRTLLGVPLLAFRSPAQCGCRRTAPSNENEIHEQTTVTDFREHALVRPAQRAARATARPQARQGRGYRSAEACEQQAHLICATASLLERYSCLSRYRFAA